MFIREFSLQPFRISSSRHVFFSFQYLHTECQRIPVYKHSDKWSAQGHEHRHRSSDRDFGMAAVREKKIQIKMQWVCCLNFVVVFFHLWVSCLTLKKTFFSRNGIWRKRMDFEIKKKSQTFRQVSTKFLAYYEC